MSKHRITRPANLDLAIANVAKIRATFGFYDKPITVTIDTEDMLALLSAAEEVDKATK